MKRTTRDVKCPYRGADYRLLHAGRQGTYWQAPDGRSVQLAASEDDLCSEQPARGPVERGRVSVLGMLIALVATGVAKR